MEILAIWFSGYFLINSNTKIIIKIYKKSFKETSNKLRLVYESVEQTKGFNFPYQIGHIGDSPTSALPHTHDIKDLDIVVVGSDGLFDNVDNEMILRMLQKHVDDSKQIKDIKNLCLELGNLTYKLSLDTYFNFY